MAFQVIQGFENSSNEPLDKTRVIAADEDAMRSIKWVYDGLVVTRLDTTPRKVFICKVDAPTDTGSPYWTALADWEEFTGTAGADGIDGSQILSDAGNPDDGAGSDGDFYLNTVTGDYFIKGKVTPGSWGSLQGNLTGPQGVQGDTGVAGADGDIYATTSSAGFDFTAAADPATITLDDVGFSYTVGQTVIVASRSNTLDNLTGDVQSYSGTTLILENVTYDPGATGANVTDLDVNLSGAPGPAGTNGTDGTDGALGKALIHTEADITLSASKINDVAVLDIPFEATPENPYSASVASDIRDPKDTPGMTTDMTKHSISFDGTSWTDNGRWVGQDGAPGSQILEGTAAPLVADGINGDFWINTVNSDYYLKELGAWVLKGNLKGSPGDPGSDGEGITEYHYNVLTNLDDIFTLGGDFNVPCVINLYVDKGIRVSLPTLSSAAPNSEIREIRVSRYNPVNGSPGVCFVWGPFLGSDQSTTGAWGVATSSFQYPQIDAGEVGIFKPTKHPGGGYNFAWTAEISGRGLETTTKWRDYTGPNAIVVGDNGYLQGRWTFRVSNGIVHYSGGITIKSSTSGSRSDVFDLGENVFNPIPFLPDPEGGVQFNSFNQVGPGNLAVFPLNVLTPTRFVVADKIYPVAGTNIQKEDCRAYLLYDGSQTDTKKRLRLGVSIDNSSTHKLNNVQFTFGGSYLQSSIVTRNAHYL